MNTCLSWTDRHRFEIQVLKMRSLSAQLQTMTDFYWAETGQPLPQPADDSTFFAP